MKKIVLIISIVCSIALAFGLGIFLANGHVFNNECLNKKGIKAARILGMPKKSMATTMMWYEGKLNGYMLGMMRALTQKIKAGDLDNDALYLHVKEKPLLATFFIAMIMAPTLRGIEDKGEYFDAYFGKRWGKVALKMHNEKGDFDSKDIINYLVVDATVDENGCLK